MVVRYPSNVPAHIQAVSVGMLLCLSVTACTFPLEDQTLPPLLPRFDTLMPATPPLERRFAVFVPDPPPPAPAPPVVAPARKGAKAPKAIPPTRFVPEALTEATVQPTVRGFFGGSNTHRYLWQANKLFVVYLKAGQWTKITLPPGERLLAAIAVDKDQFEGQTAHVGPEPHQQPVILVRPLIEQGQADVPLLTESGRSYDLRLVVGNLYMFAVAFALQPILEVPDEEMPPLARRP